MKHLISIAFTQSDNNFDEFVTLAGHKIRVTQFCTNFNTELAKEIIRKFDGQCDAIALSGMPQDFQVKGRTFVHYQTHEIKKTAKETPLVDGALFKDIYIPWVIRKFHLQNTDFFKGKKVAFYTGALQKDLVATLSDFGVKLSLLDPYFLLKLPFLITTKKQLENFLHFLMPIFKKMEVKERHIPDFSNMPDNLRSFFDSDIFVANAATLNLIDLDHLKGKTLIVDFLNPALEMKLQEVGVDNILSSIPKTLDNPNINYSIFEGLLQTLQSDGSQLTNDDILHWIEELELKPSLTVFGDHSKKDTDKIDRFAFIVHPLHKKQFFLHPSLKWMRRFSKPLEGVAEQIGSMLPGHYYGKITGAVSEKTGKQIEGLIYMVTDTPKILLEKDPSSIYRKLGALCEKAEQSGAKIIGLGAYTKIVGDAGVTVERNSPIPVTTGNSLSAAATLWAAKYAVNKLGFVKREPGKLYQGKVMIVGATGSIGSVSAKILANKWEEVVLVAPRAYKLLELKDEMEVINPKCQVQVATNPDTHIHECDLIITTTSAQGRKILDIEKVKPGAVICDVSRPFDISEEDALKRPDVMVIASGEVQLPGDTRLNCNIGLEGNIVYACLAETALLLMENKLESFTLSRNINYEKVLQIDQMAKEHGVRLSAIMGPNSGIITDEEFDLCREHAKKAMKLSH